MHLWEERREIIDVSFVCLCWLGRFKTKLIWSKKWYFPPTKKIYFTVSQIKLNNWSTFHTRTKKMEKMDLFISLFSDGGNDKMKSNHQNEMEKIAYKPRLYFMQHLPISSLSLWPSLSLPSPLGFTLPITTTTATLTLNRNPNRILHESFWSHKGGLSSAPSSSSPAKGKTQLQKEKHNQKCHPHRQHPQLICRAWKEAWATKSTGPPPTWMACAGSATLSKRTSKVSKRGRQKGGWVGKGRGSGQIRSVTGGALVSLQQFSSLGSTRHLGC